MLDIRVSEREGGGMRVERWNLIKMKIPSSKKNAHEELMTSERRKVDECVHTKGSSRLSFHIFTDKSRQTGSEMWREKENIFHSILCRSLFFIHM